MLSFHSVDSNQMEFGANTRDAYPIEYLHNLDNSGLPETNKKLQFGYIVIFLIKLAPNHGLCNGSRIVITRTSY